VQTCAPLALPSILGQTDSLDAILDNDERACTRRRFLSRLVSLGGFSVASSVLGRGFELLAVGASDTRPAAQLARYPEKKDLILLTDRPPHLETPLDYFRTDLTPNDAFFVRWHLSGIPTTIDLQTFRLEVSGHVSRPLSLSLNDLRSKFDPVSVVALNQCSGNFRSWFEPKVPGGQWASGAMGNARWKGVRLKDLLDSAGVLPGSGVRKIGAIETKSAPSQRPWPQLFLCLRPPAYRRPSLPQSRPPAV
jgi:DMSO/TMAO reductase YedYZ molybdopterin-dependent catalytic subunit